MYEVIVAFCDLEDSNYSYEVGAKYPRDGFSPCTERLKELSSQYNLVGTPLIKKIDEGGAINARRNKKAFRD